MAKRVFWVVLDSFGVGAEPDAAAFGDEGTSTIAAVCTSDKLSVPNMTRLGLFNLDGVTCGTPCPEPVGAYARLQERSMGKDTTIGHWELAGIVSEKPMPTFPNGFPAECIAELEKAFGRKILCNRPYSGTKVIADYGEEHLKTGALIVYTSADSVLQIAAHEDIVPPEQLYELCRKARAILTGPWAVGRVIARPFVGTCAANFTRTPNRHDFSLVPFAPTALDAIKGAGLDVISVGKIVDIFAGAGITEYMRTTGNEEGIDDLLKLAGRDFHGLAFVNLVDFDMLYGHRRDVPGYAAALTRFDACLPQLMAQMGPDDLLMITADHGCDPSYTKTTDHTREYVPLLMYGGSVRPGSLGTHVGYGAAGVTAASFLGVPTALQGDNLWPAINKNA